MNRLERLRKAGWHFKGTMMKWLRRRAATFCSERSTVPSSSRPGIGLLGRTSTASVRHATSLATITYRKPRHSRSLAERRSSEAKADMHERIGTANRHSSQAVVSEMES